MTLHRTSVHHEALGLIRDGRVVWRPAALPSAEAAPRRSAGFAYAGGNRLDHDMLVALYELRTHRLIAVVDDVAGLTADGRARLSEWDGTKARGPMKGLAIAAVVGATTSALLYLAVTVGVDMYFRAMGWRETRRSSKESA